VRVHVHGTVQGAEDVGVELGPRTPATANTAGRNRSVLEAGESGPGCVSAAGHVMGGVRGYAGGRLARRTGESNGGGEEDDRRWRAQG
jgi:hypothetical protein